MSWIRLVSIIFCAIGLGNTLNTWENPGCHKVGYKQNISIPDCVEFSMILNACQRFCELFSMPSSPLALVGHKPPEPVTSVGQCCNIMETEDVQVRVLCVNGIRNLTFKSATNCSCYHCKKD